MLKAGFSVARSLRAGPATPSASPSHPCPRPPLSARPPGGTRPSLSRPSPEQVRPPFRASGRSPANACGAARRGAGSGSSAARIARVPAILSPRSPFVRELCPPRPPAPPCPCWRHATRPSRPTPGHRQRLPRREVPSPDRTSTVPGFSGLPLAPAGAGAWREDGVFILHSAPPQPSACSVAGLPKARRPLAAAPRGAARGLPRPPPSCGARRCFPPWAPALSRVGPHGP